VDDPFKRLLCNHFLLDIAGLLVPKFKNSVSSDTLVCVHWNTA